MTTGPLLSQKRPVPPKSIRGLYISYDTFDVIPQM